jgi:hypothetical protein
MDRVGLGKPLDGLAGLLRAPSTVRQVTPRRFKHKPRIQTLGNEAHDLNMGKQRQSSWDITAYWKES